MLPAWKWLQTAVQQACRWHVSAALGLASRVQSAASRIVGEERARVEAKSQQFATARPPPAERCQEGVARCSAVTRWRRTRTGPRPPGGGRQPTGVSRPPKLGWPPSGSSLRGRAIPSAASLTRGSGRAIGSIRPRLAESSQAPCVCLRLHARMPPQLYLGQSSGAPPRSSTTQAAIRHAQQHRTRWARPGTPAERAAVGSFKYNYGVVVVLRTSVTRTKKFQPHVP